MYHTMYKHVLLYNTSIYTWIVGATDERKHIFLGTLSLGQAAAVSTRKWCKKETNGKMLRVLKNPEKLNFLAHHLQKALTDVVHNCTIFLCSLDVKYIYDDQCRGPSIKEKDHLVG